MDKPCHVNKAVKVSKNIFIWLIVGFLLFSLFDAFQSSSSSKSGTVMAFSEFTQQVQEGKVREVVIQGNKIAGILTDGQKFALYAPDDAGLVDRLLNKDVRVTAVPPEEDASFWSGLLYWLPFVLFIGVWIFFMRQMAAGNGKAMNFGKSRARMLEGQGKVTFADVAGIDEAKEDLVEIVDFLKDPPRFQRLGGKIPRGVLLVGPPGTGKTLLAKAIAGEADVPFFTISGSDFVEMFVGVGASRVRDMFDQARKHSPCLVFIDEIDAVGRHRGAGLGGGNDEREQTLNQLLVEMDGFDTNEAVILIAATNRPDVLDPALLRPGRFDRQVVVPNPDLAGREKILAVHTKKSPMGPDVDLKKIARGTPGFSGADLANLVNEAALLAARRNKRVVTMAEFEYAKDKVMMGAERKSHIMTEEDKKMTAYHEAGHALMILESKHSDPLHKVTIIPRGRALGLTMSLPTDDKDSRSYIYMKERMAICFGGRVAEEMIFGEEQVSTGASQDIRTATSIARNMVTQWGMNKDIGPIAIEEPDGEVFLGYSISQRKNVSEELAAKVDAEIKALVEEAYATCRRVLAEKRDVLEAIAQGLLEYETLTAEEVKALLNGEKLTREEPGVHISARSTVPVTDPSPEKTEAEKAEDVSETPREEEKKDADTSDDSSSS
ncbi:MAG: ATP-dependent zinc metalloprotease FtsH [Alphaproteobacteria bacterium]|nr:ATP-dependent zinc metalloprotease FtsH [Alphaproteobacteria bacterium]